MADDIKKQRILFEISNISWFKAIGVLLLQMAVCLGGLYIYGILSWLIFGESADSLSDTYTNELVWFVSPILFTSVFNISKIIEGKRKNNAQTVSTYFFIATTLFIIYVMFTLLVLNKQQI
ncbi:MAG: hypothetical protein V4592_20155 [Bacteroidota bacterium]